MSQSKLFELQQLLEIQLTPPATRCLVCSARCARTCNPQHYRLAQVTIGRIVSAPDLQLCLSVIFHSWNSTISKSFAERKKNVQRTTEKTTKTCYNAKWAAAVYIDAQEKRIIPFLLAFAALLYSIQSQHNQFCKLGPLSWSLADFCYLYIFYCVVFVEYNGNNAMIIITILPFLSVQQAKMVFFYCGQVGFSQLSSLILM